jgi:hypothetical protein
MPVGAGSFGDLVNALAGAEEFDDPGAFKRGKVIAVGLTAHCGTLEPREWGVKAEGFLDMLASTMVEVMV